MNTIQFLISSIIIILIPGTGVTYTIAVGLSKGKKESLIAATGCTLGIIPHFLVSLLLSSLLIRMNPTIFLILKLVGAIYLIYLGIGMFQSHSKFASNMNPEKKQMNSCFSVIRKAILINLLNPKLTLFFFSFLPQYARSDKSDYVIQCIFYGLLFMMLTQIIFMIYGLLASSMHQIFLNHSNAMNVMLKIFGCIFIIFAIQLAVSSAGI